jgi:hypothetical protein
VITILTWLWAQPDGRTRFTADHVNIWAAMVRRHTTIPVALACVTDMPEGIDPGIEIIQPPREFEDVRIPTWGDGRPQCLRRISMFRPDAGKIFGERFACMDLDCVIANSLDAILSCPEDFRMCQGTARGRPYNGSLIVMTAGARPQVYEKFTPEGAVEAGRKFIGSDQAWISHCLGPNEATFGLDDGVQMSAGWFNPEACLTFYPGHFKPWDVVKVGGNPWVEEHYRSEPRGRGVYLGYGPSVWEDAMAAFDEPADWVIASPEAAEHWTGVDAVVRNDGEARRVARMMGYDLVMCGASGRMAA